MSYLTDMIIYLTYSPWARESEIKKAKVMKWMNQTHRDWGKEGDRESQGEREKQTDRETCAVFDRYDYLSDIQPLGKREREKERQRDKHKIKKRKIEKE